jgi:hypothetical protein
MLIVKEPISKDYLREMAEMRFGNLVKAVVDIRQRIMAIDGELHADEEALLIDDGSHQEDLWGINMYPEFSCGDPGFVEFDSMINLRPTQNNRSRGVDDPVIQKQILIIVTELVV